MKEAQRPRTQEQSKSANSNADADAVVDPSLDSKSSSGLTGALPQRITMKTFKPTNERRAVICFGTGCWLLAAGCCYSRCSVVGVDFMKFNKLILNYVPNWQISPAMLFHARLSANTLQPLDFYANRFRVYLELMMLDSDNHLSRSGSRNKTSIPQVGAALFGLVFWYMAKLVHWRRTVSLLAHVFSLACLSLFGFNGILFGYYGQQLGPLK